MGLLFDSNICIGVMDVLKRESKNEALQMILAITEREGSEAIKTLKHNKWPDN